MPHRSTASPSSRRRAARRAIARPAVAGASRVTYSFAGLDEPDGAASRVPLAINNAGQVVGDRTDAAGVTAGFLAGSAGGPAPLVDGDRGLDPAGINNRGTIVGTADASGRLVGFLRPAAGPVAYLDGPAPGTVARPRGVNDAHVVVGEYRDARHRRHAFLYEPARRSYTRLDVAGTTDHHLIAIGNFRPVPDRGGRVAVARVLGGYVDAAGLERNYLGTVALTADGFALRDVAALAAPGAAAGATFAAGLNNRGQIVGHYFDPDGGQHGFLFDAASGRYATIDDPAAAGRGTELRGINDHGRVVGTSVADAGGVRGFIGLPVVAPAATPRPAPAPAGARPRRAARA